jgi:predicted nucleotidyltransferase
MSYAALAVLRLGMITANAITHKTTASDLSLSSLPFGKIEASTAQRIRPASTSSQIRQSDRK